MGEPQDPDQADQPDQDQVWEELPPEVEYPLRPGEDTEEAKAGRLEAWKKRTATGAILSSFALGLREAIEPNRNEPAIVLETSGVPPKDLPVEADLDDAPPRQSVVRIRPWLLEGADEAAADPDDRAESQSEADADADASGARPPRGR